MHNCNRVCDVRVTYLWQFSLKKRNHGSIWKIIFELFKTASAGSLGKYKRGLEDWYFENKLVCMKQIMWKFDVTHLKKNLYKWWDVEADILKKEETFLICIRISDFIYFLFTTVKTAHLSSQEFCIDNFCVEIRPDRDTFF